MIYGVVCQQQQLDSIVYLHYKFAVFAYFVVIYIIHYLKHAPRYNQINKAAVGQQNLDAPEYSRFKQQQQYNNKI